MPLWAQRKAHSLRHFVKQIIVDIMKEEICNSVPEEMLIPKRKRITKVEKQLNFSKF